MKNMRKIISLLLCALTVFSFFVISVSAAECEHQYSSTYVAPTCAEAGYTLYVCSACGDNYKDYGSGQPALGHAYGAWYSVDTPTCNNEGHDKRECGRCGAADIRTLPIVDHVDVNSDGKCDFCSKEMSSSTGVSPFDWLIALINFIKQWFSDLFA